MGFGRFQMSETRAIKQPQNLKLMRETKEQIAATILQLSFNLYKAAKRLRAIQCWPWHLHLCVQGKNRRQHAMYNICYVLRHLAKCFEDGWMTSLFSTTSRQRSYNYHRDQ